MKPKLLKYLSAAFLSTFLLAGNQEAAAQQSANTLRWASDSAINVTNPYYNTLREARLFIAQMVWDTLIYRDPKTGEYVPLLATRWNWQDSTTLDLQLRSDVSFHDGHKFTADDVVYTLNYVVDPASKVNVQSNVNWIASAEKLGEYAVRIKLKAPFGAALEYLATMLPILPKGFKAPGAIENPKDGTIPGTGPYRFMAFEAGRSVTLERNPAYMENSPKKKPGIERVIYRTIPDKATQVAELLGNGVDWIWGVPKDQMPRLASVKRLSVVASPTMRVTYLSFSLDPMGGKNPFADFKVRQAVAAAIDRRTIVEQVVGEGGAVADRPCYSGQFGCVGDPVVWKYDPKQAAKLLAEAGYSKGFNFDVPGYGDRNRSEAVNGYLDAAGMHPKLLQLQYAAARERFNTKAAPAFHGEWGSYSINDVSAIFDNFFTGSVDDHWQDVDLKRWILDARASTDPVERERLYALAVHRITERLYWLPLFIVPATYAYSSDLDFSAWPDENPRFYLSRWK